MRFGLGAVFGLVPVIAFAGSYSVGPLTITLDRAARTGLVKVVNDDSKPLQMQIRLQEWIQDKQGVSSRKESEDLVYFPRVMTLQPKEERLVRIGLKVPAVDYEKAYTLFLEEVPVKSGAQKEQGMQIAVATRFGVAVFLAPNQVKKEAVLESGSLNKGILSFNVKNTGNVHVSIQAIQLSADGEQVKKDIAGGTTLVGATKAYQVSIPAEICHKAEHLDIVMQSYDAFNKLELRSGLKVDHMQCQ